MPTNATGGYAMVLELTEAHCNDLIAAMLSSTGVGDNIDFLTIPMLLGGPGQITLVTPQFRVKFDTGRSDAIYLDITCSGIVVANRHGSAILQITRTVEGPDLPVILLRNVVQFATVPTDANGLSSGPMVGTIAFLLPILQPDSRAADTEAQRAKIFWEAGDYRVQINDDDPFWSPLRRMDPTRTAVQTLRFDLGSPLIGGIGLATGGPGGNLALTPPIPAVVPDATGHVTPPPPTSLTPAIRSITMLNVAYSTTENGPLLRILRVLIGTIEASGDPSRVSGIIDQNTAFGVRVSNQFLLPYMIHTINALLLSPANTFVRGLVFDGRGIQLGSAVITLPTSLGSWGGALQGLKIGLGQNAISVSGALMLSKIAYYALPTDIRSLLQSALDMDLVEVGVGFSFDIQLGVFPGTSVTPGSPSPPLFFGIAANAQVHATLNYGLAGYFLIAPILSGLLDFVPGGGVLQSQIGVLAGQTVTLWLISTFANISASTTVDVTGSTQSGTLETSTVTVSNSLTGVLTTITAPAIPLPIPSAIAALVSGPGLTRIELDDLEIGGRILAPTGDQVLNTRHAPLIDRLSVEIAPGSSLGFVSGQPSEITVSKTSDPRSVLALSEDGETIHAPAATIFDAKHHPVECLGLRDLERARFGAVEIPVRSLPQLGTGTAAGRLPSHAVLLGVRSRDQLLARCMLWRDEAGVVQARITSFDPARPVAWLEERATIAQRSDVETTWDPLTQRSYDVSSIATRVTVRCATRHLNPTSYSWIVNGVRLDAEGSLDTAGFLGRYRADGDSLVVVNAVGSGGKLRVSVDARDEKGQAARAYDEYEIESHEWAPLPRKPDAQIIADQSRRALIEVQHFLSSGQHDVSTTANRMSRSPEVNSAPLAPTVLAVGVGAMQRGLPSRRRGAS